MGRSPHAAEGSHIAKWDRLAGGGHTGIRARRIFLSRCDTGSGRRGAYYLYLGSEKDPTRGTSVLIELFRLIFVSPHSFHVHANWICLILPNCATILGNHTTDFFFGAKLQSGLVLCGLSYSERGVHEALCQQGKASTSL